jgi:DNA-directed RNA polymerase specialized sigma subunit
MNGEDLIERNKEIVHLYVQHRLTLREVGARFQLSRDQVADILRRAGVGRRTRSVHRLTPQELAQRNQEIVRLYVEDGLTLREVGGRLGVSERQVSRVLEATGVSRRKAGTRSGPE